MASAKRPAWWWATAWANRACGSRVASSAPVNGAASAAARAKKGVGVTVVDGGREDDPDGDYSAGPYASGRFPLGIGWGVDEDAEPNVQQRLPLQGEGQGGGSMNEKKRALPWGSARWSRPTRFRSS